MSVFFVEYISAVGLNRFSSLRTSRVLVDMSEARQDWC